MSAHYEDAGLRLWHGKNLDVLQTFEAASFDSIVTDPPYEIAFMGKRWDSSGIAYDVDVWRECLRVLKPGGHMLSFGGTRTWHRIAVAIEDAGFEIRDSIAWMYGSGFPKSMNVAKAIASGTGRPEDIRRLSMGDDYTPSGRGRVKYDHGGGSVMNGAPDVDVALPESAKAWEGWGTTLKPAFEPIIVARKPLIGTVAANVLAYGTGAINIDASRVGTESTKRTRTATDFGLVNDDGWTPTPGENGSDSGRWPTNVLLDETQAAELDKQTGILKSGKMAAGTQRAPRDGAIYGRLEGDATSRDTPGDWGGASRFFPKFELTPDDVAWQLRLMELPTFRYEAKAPGTERPEVDGVEHATVKPLSLMRWLVRLVTRTGGRTLDIYAGSGTTGEAALLEGMEVDLIELEADHLPLILQRIRKPLQPSILGDWGAA